MKKLFILLAFLTSITQCYELRAQTWYDVSEGGFCIFGQGWPSLSQKKFQRLPITTKTKLNNQNLWNASLLNSGLYVRFRTNSTSINVRFTLNKQAVQFYNISSFGQSGVDLYARSNDGKTFHWLGNHLNYGFGSPSTANFRNIVPENMEGNSECEYMLYMPSFNTVSKLEIGVNDDATFEYITVPDNEEPIVVYGSSAVQGSSASRPGNAWTNILGRLFDTQVVNLGFANRAKLEEEVFKVIADLKPQVFIIDAMPDMIDSPELVKERIITGVKILQAMTNRPVLLVESPGPPDRLIRPELDEKHNLVNTQLREAFDQLVTDGYTNLFYMTREELALTEDDFLDGVNPNDLGMKHYAAAYSAKLAYINENKDPIIDGVQSVNTGNTATNNHLYDLKGRDVTNSPSLPKGIYIMNGKKIVLAE